MPTPSIPDAIPAAQRADLAAVLVDLPEHRRLALLLRIERWWDDLRAGVAVYDNADEVAGRATLVAARAFAARDDDLHLLDERRTLQPDWFQSPGMIGYAGYAERIAAAGTGLMGITDRIGHLRRLGVNYLHLMPLLRPRPAPNDGGYAVADYRSVREDLGTIDDLRQVATQLREAGISLCLDLVLNHVAREHAWAVAARAGDPHYRAYFHIFADRQTPDAFEATLPEVFPDFAPGNFSHDPDLDGWVWTTFNDYQWDLAWNNPDVFVEMADVVCFLANLGVEVLRLDAIAFIWKRMGTTCQNQPEVHALTQALRAVTRIACPALIFKAEAIVGPDDLVAYLGRGPHHGKVSDLAYHNSLMVHVWSMLASRDARLASNALSRIPAIPSRTTWITYLRCHDDIGWAIDDQDAASVFISGPGHRGFLSDFYSGRFAGSFADGLVFQYNPATGDRRISGTAASLAGVGQALLDGDEQHLGEAIARVLLGYAIILGFGGVPVIWSGDEFGALNDEDWAADPAHAEDNRWAHRPRLAADLVATIDDDDQAQTPSGRIWAGLRHLIATRVGLAQLHAHHESRAVGTPDAGVFAVVQNHPLGTFLGLYNITEQQRSVPGWWLAEHGLDPSRLREHISGGPVGLTDGVLRLASYQPMWLTLDAAQLT